MRKAVLAVLLSATAFIAGCPDEPAMTRLPDPFHRDHRPSPPPRPPIVAQGPTPPAAEGPLEGLLPPGGIRRKWRYIVIHHSDSDIGSLGKIDQWHRDKGWDGCGYDFVIGNGTNSPDGKIEASPRWKAQESGAHTRLSTAFSRQKGIAPNYYNEAGIGIVMVGNFDKVRPTPKQLASLARLVKFLMQQCQIPESRVVTHGGVDQTHCPGKHFSRTQVLLMVRGLR